MDLNVYYSKIVIDDIEVNDIIQMAYDMLVAGYESDDLCSLAVENENAITRYDALKKIKAILTKLDIKYPSPNEAMFEIVKIWCLKIVDNEITPYEGAKKIAYKCSDFRVSFSEYKHQNNIGMEFYLMYHSFEEIEYSYRDGCKWIDENFGIEFETKENVIARLNELIVEEAKRYLS